MSLPSMNAAQSLTDPASATVHLYPPSRAAQRSSNAAVAQKMEQRRRTVTGIDTNHIIERHVNATTKDQWEDSPSKFNTAFLAGWVPAYNVPTRDGNQLAEQLTNLAEDVVGDGARVALNGDTYAFYKSYWTSSLSIPTGWGQEQYPIYYGVRVIAKETTPGEYDVKTMYPKGGKDKSSQDNRPFYII